MEPDSQHFPKCFHRVTIKGLYVRDGKLLMIRESPQWSGKWELPGGGLDFGEDLQTAFAREVKEEMGLTVTKMAERPLYVWTFKYLNRRKMDWYYSLVLAYRVEFADLNFTPTDECEEIAFFSKEDLETLVTDGQMLRLKEFFNPEDFKDPF